MFAHVLYTVRTGRPTSEEAFGRPYIEWLNEDAEAAAVCNRAMTLGARGALPTILRLELWRGAGG